MSAENVAKAKAYDVTSDRGAPPITSESAARVSQTQANMRDRLRKGTRLIPQGKSGITRKETEFPVQGQLVAKWVEPISRETADELSFFRDVPHNSKEWGTKIAPIEKLAQIKRDALQKQEQLQLLQLGSQLIDQQFPETQEHAFAVLPELKTAPEEYMQSAVVEQMAIWYILRTGIIRGKKDLELIFLILRGDYDLPVGPLWDPGSFVSSALSDAFPEVYKTGEGDLIEMLAKLNEGDQKQSMLSQTLFGPIQNGGAGEAKEKFNAAMKVVIAKRVFPNLRRRKNEEVLDFIHHIMNRDSFSYFEDAFYTTGPAFGAALGSVMDNGLRDFGVLKTKTRATNFGARPPGGPEEQEEE